MKQADELIAAQVVKFSFIFVILNLLNLNYKN